MNLGKGTIIGLSIVVLLAFFGMYGCNKRNSFIDKEEQVKAQWQQVENQYQRRLDLIPNIVATVEGQAKFEKETLKEVVEARASATKVSLNVDNLNEESIAKYQKVQGELSSALSRLLMVSENYPELKANQAFSDLRVELEGCENRIAEERRKFNESAKDYNASIRKIPGSLFAWGFEKAAYFQAEEGAEKAPKLKFNI
jgi:LemA protein